MQPLQGKFNTSEESRELCEKRVNASVCIHKPTLDEMKALRGVIHKDFVLPATKELIVWYPSIIVSLLGWKIILHILQYMVCGVCGSFICGLATITNSHKHNTIHTLHPQQIAFILAVRNPQGQVAFQVPGAGVVARLRGNIVSIDARLLAFLPNVYGFIRGVVVWIACLAYTAVATVHGWTIGLLNAWVLVPLLARAAPGFLWLFDLVEDVCGRLDPYVAMALQWVGDTLNRLFVRPIRRVGRGVVFAALIALLVWFGSWIRG